MGQETGVLTADELRNFSWLAESWVTSLTEALRTMGCEKAAYKIEGDPETIGTAPPASEATDEASDAPQDAAPAENPVEAVPAASDDLDVNFWAQSFNIHASHCVWMRSDSKARKAIGRQVLIAAGLDEPEDADIDSTWQEVLTQSMAGLAQRLTKRCGREVTCLSGLPVSGFDAFGAQVRLNVRITEEIQLELLIACNQKLLSELVRAGYYRDGGWISRDQRSGDRRGRAARAGAAASPTSAPPVTPKGPDAIPFDSVLDMNIPVSISFGSTKLRLDEALLLREGSLVSLGRAIDEPVELQVNGRVVARGQIIAVRGQYGIRIEEISSQGERLNQLDPAHRTQIEASLNN